MKEIIGTFRDNTTILPGREIWLERNRIFFNGDESKTYSVDEFLTNIKPHKSGILWATGQPGKLRLLSEVKPLLTGTWTPSS